MRLSMNGANICGPALVPEADILSTWFYFRYITRRRSYYSYLAMLKSHDVARHVALLELYVA